MSREIRGILNRPRFGHFIANDFEEQAPGKMLPKTFPKAGWHDLAPHRYNARRLKPLA
jgi:hypothetical protein